MLPARHARILGANQGVVIHETDDAASVLVLHDLGLLGLLGQGAFAGLAGHAHLDDVLAGDHGVTVVATEPHGPVDLVVGAKVDGLSPDRAARDVATELVGGLQDELQQETRHLLGEGRAAAEIQLGVLAAGIHPGLAGAPERRQGLGVG